jgi:hypothetical protein
VNTSQRERQRDISQNRNQSARASQREGDQRLLSKEVILQEKTLLRSEESKNRYENRNTNEEKLPPEEADDKETMLKTNQILQEKMPNKELKHRDNSQNR